jgi:hypothetical protein
MWCNAHPSTWQNLDVTSEIVPWTIQRLIEQKNRLVRGEIKEARDAQGVVDYPLWDFIEPSHYVFPELHVEIGLVNNMVDSFYDFVEEQVEVAPPEERMARNHLILADIAVLKAKEKADGWKETGGTDLAMQRYCKSQVSKSLKSKRISAEERESLKQQQQEIDNNISALVDQRKALEADVTNKRKNLTAARAKLKEVRAKKKKIETPFLAEIENILLQHNICAAAYHGGKLNGVDCREFLQLATVLFEKIQIYLLSTSNPDRCTDQDIIKTCCLYRDMSITLDTLASKLRLKHGEPQECDYQIAEKALANLEYLWKMANLSFTPKIHCLLVHAIHQMRSFDGIGDTLEDDVEHMHQISARIEARVSRMKDKDKQALVHSKMEAIQFNVEVTEKIELSKISSKRAFKKRKPELCAAARSQKLKMERDDIRNETLLLVDQKPHAQLISSYDQRKAEMLLQKE